MLTQRDCSETLVANGVSTCAGCALEIIIRRVLEILGKDTIIVIPPGCAALFSGYGENTALKIPGFQGNLENTAAIAAGIRAGLAVQGKNNVNVLGFAGDGATVDIGLQALSGVFERKDKVLYICYDNEAYMNTGIQSSGATPYNAKTTTTPGGKRTLKKDMLEIAAAHRIDYIASASVGYINDLQRKIRKAMKVNGPSYIHIHTPCPTGWGFEPGLTIDVARKAFETGAWSLFEIEDGKKRITKDLNQRKPVIEYLKFQKRFDHLDNNDIVEIEKNISENIELLKRDSRDE